MPKTTQKDSARTSSHARNACEKKTEGKRLGYIRNEERK